MFIFSEFTDKVIILNGKEIGYIKDLLFDKISIKVIGFVIKKKLFDYSYIEIDDIEKIEKGFIEIKKEGENLSIENYEILQKKVVDLFGNEIGIIDDLEFSSRTGKLSSIYVNLNFNFYITNKFMRKFFSKNYTKIKAKNIIEFKKDKIIVKNIHTIKESKKILENINNFFINTERTSFSFKKF